MRVGRRARTYSDSERVSTSQKGERPGKFLAQGCRDIEFPAGQDRTGQDRTARMRMVRFIINAGWDATIHQILSPQ